MALQGIGLQSAVVQSAVVQKVASECQRVRKK